MRSAVLSLLLVAFGCQGKPAARPDDVVGKVTAVAGEVTASRPAQAAARADVGLAVTRDMTFTTAAGASLEITFANGYTWRLEERQTRAIAGLAVVDRAPASGASGPGAKPEDRTASAGRHAEQEAGETEATTTTPPPSPAPPGAAAQPAPEPVTAPPPPPAVEPIPPPPPPPRPPRPKATPRPVSPDVEQEVPEPNDAPKSPPPRPADEPAPVTAPSPPPVTAPSPPPPPSPPPEPERDDRSPSAAPERLTREEIRATMGSTEPGVKACKVTAATTLRMRITVAPSGDVTTATAEGEHAGTPLERCAAAVVKKVRFRRFGGEPLTMIYPYRLAAP